VPSSKVLVASVSTWNTQCDGSADRTEGIERQRIHKARCGRSGLSVALLFLSSLFAASGLMSCLESSPVVSEAQEPKAIEPGATMVDSRTGIELAFIPAGSFVMGSPLGEKGRDEDETQHEVTLTEPFWMGTTEVTNAQYLRFVEATGHRRPRYWDDPNVNALSQPVVGVAWEDAAAFASWAGMSLPTEAQWEYAARAGTTTAYWSGDTRSDLIGVGWCFHNSGGYNHSVGEKPASTWGLYDIHGNVFEWCSGSYGEYLPGPQTDPTGPSHGGKRVIRGGGGGDGVRAARSAYRHACPSNWRVRGIGFRLVLPADQG
jgi:formylglycine-generating enzyme